MVTGKSSPKDDAATRIGFLISIAIHLILLGVVLLSPPPAPPLPAVVTVTIETPLRRKAAQEPQIVSPSETAERVPPPDIPTKLSEKDSFTEREQIKRGADGGPPGPRAPEAQPAPPQKQSQQQQRMKEPAPPQRRENTEQAEKPRQKEAPKKTSETTEQPIIKDLKLDDATLSKRFGKQEQSESEKRASEPRENSVASYEAFSRPPGSGAAFLGNAGISDHLPNLPDGDITLLNAKANTYAGFVRRVAVQVFAQLRAQGWERLSAQEIRQLNGFTTIEAVLSPEGKFMRVRLLDGSGSVAFDTVVSQAVSSGASDPNPPAGAQASDGLIHFIFKARSWSQVGSDRRTGAPVEHRWLLLATGLE